MILPGSRYENSKPFSAPAGSKGAFGGVRPRPIGPAPGVIEHTVVSGDRLDLLARHYYNDDRLWWRIADANPEALFGGDLVREVAKGQEGQPGFLASRIGRVILIPRARE